MNYYPIEIKFFTNCSVMFEKKDDLFCDIRIFYLICECKLKFMKCKYKTLLSEGYERGYGLHVKYVNERYGLFNQSRTGST